MSIDPEAKAAIVQELVDVIRTQKPMLWVGAGLSKCAGLPGSVEIVNAILASCTNEDDKKYLVSRGETLSHVAQAFENVMGRERLLEIVATQIQGSKAELSLHRSILDIPQFDVIVTTNYDRLFEQCAPEEDLVIVRGSGGTLIPASKRQTTLYKVHGCISERQTIVLTEDDYLQWFKEYRESPAWNRVYSLMAERPVIFMGFSFADQNIRHLVKCLLEWLPSGRTTGFLIDTNIPPGQQNSLLKLNLRGVNADIRDVVCEIREAIIHSLLIDAAEGRIDVDRATAVSKRVGYEPEWSTDSDGTVLRSIRPLDGRTLNGSVTLFSA